MMGRERQRGRKWKPLAALLILFLAASTAITLAGVHAAPTWSIQTMDTSSGGPIELLMDSHGNPRLLYGHYQGSDTSSPFHLVYAVWTGSSWGYQGVPSQIERYIIDFTLDSKDNPYALVNMDDSLIVATWVGSSLTLVNITKERGISSKSSLSLDSADKPHVAYTVNLPSSEIPSGVTNNVAMVKYASWNGSAWATERIDSPISHWSGAYLDLNSDDQPTIMYGYENMYFPPGGGYQSTWTAKLASWNGSAWNIQTAASDLADFGNMVLDSKGNPHLLYSRDYPTYRSGNSTLSYASWNGSAWSSLIVVANADVYFGAYLALDYYDYPHIDFLNGTSGSLVYAGWTGSIWDFQTVGPESLAIEPGPIAMDPNGTAHIAYTGYPGFLPFRAPKYTMYAFAPQPIYEPPTPPNPDSPDEGAWSNWLIVGVSAAIAAAVAIGALAYLRKRRSGARQE